jgi:taurine dioxygenase
MSMHLSEAPRSKLRRQIAVEPVTTTIGAEIKGVDLGKGIDDELFRVLHEALMTHQVIFLRDQNLTTEQHLDLAGRFGEPAYSKKLPMYDGIETVSLLENDGSKRVVGDIWHTDNTDIENPPMGALLYAEAAPSVGGDTNWASMYAAYDALSDGMKRYLEKLTALHDNSAVKRRYAGANTLRGEGIAVAEPVEHPIVRVHPVTGRRSLFVNSVYTQHVVGVPAIESRHILSMLFEHVMRPEFHVRFRWRRGSLAIWHNRCTQHYAVGDYRELRRMRRVQIVGDKPRGPA